MLEHLLFDAAIMGGSVAADSLSAYAAAKKLGIGSELEVGTLEGMMREGIGKHLAKSTINQVGGLLTFGALLYGVDYALGMNDNGLNLHHAFIYGASGLKYLAAAANTFRTLDMEPAAKVTELPVQLFVRAIVPLLKNTLGKPKIKIGNRIFAIFNFGYYDAVK